MGYSGISSRIVPSRKFKLINIKWLCEHLKRAGPAVLTLDDITKQIRSTFEQFTDPRQGKNRRYTLVDAGLSAFSVFFMQSPSFLEYQRSLDQWLGRNNAQTLFGVHQIPSDNQIRHLLDATDPGQVNPLFSFLFQALHQAGVVETYRSVNQTLLLAFDGVEYFSSQRSIASTVRPGNTPTAR